VRAAPPDVSEDKALSYVAGYKAPRPLRRERRAASEHHVPRRSRPDWTKHRPFDAPARWAVDRAGDDIGDPQTSA